jgi:hypothetical protein
VKGSKKERLEEETIQVPKDASMEPTSAVFSDFDNKFF